MKQLTCEMCGSTDLMKQDGMFVCQSCGTRYSVEEARKLMIEGTVNVTGSTVKVDTSAELANLYQIARRAKDDNNSENAAKYYDMILVKDPTSWEAAFYVVYFKAMECKIAQIKSAAISVSNCEDSVLFLIKNHVPESEQLAAVKEIVCRSSQIAHILENGAKNHYDGIDSDIQNKYLQEYVDNASAARDILYTCGTQIDRIFGDNPEIGKLAVDAWKDGIGMHRQLLSYYADKDGHNRFIDSYVEKICKYLPDYSRDYKKLKNEISALQRIITTNTSGLNGANDNGDTGIQFLAAGISIIFFAFICGAVIKSTLWAVTLGSLATLLVVSGIFLRRKAKKDANTISSAIANAKKELEKKEAELQKL